MHIRLEGNACHPQIEAGSPQKRADVLRLPFGAGFEIEAAVRMLTHCFNPTHLGLHPAQTLQITGVEEDHDPKG